MKYIKGVYRHGSETFLIIDKDEKSLELKNIIKSSTTENGINSIITECEGINWYNNFSKNKITYYLHKKTKTYYVLKIEVNEGFFNIKFDPSYLNTKKYLDLIIKHYIQIWDEYRGCEFAPFHGDLSLVGNVLFNSKDEVLFIDWEHFNKNKNIPTGLDIIMSLLEYVFYDLNHSNKLDIHILKHVTKSIHSLNTAKLLSPLFLQDPLKNTLKFINSNKDIWNKQYFKLPILSFSKDSIEEIDDTILKYYKLMV